MPEQILCILKFPRTAEIQLLSTTYIWRFVGGFFGLFLGLGFFGLFGWVFVFVVV